MQVFIPMIPPTTTHQQKQVMTTKAGRQMHYEPPKLADARAKLMAHFGQHAPANPFSGPLRVHVKWCFPIKGKWNHGDYKPTRPDAHNLQKLFFDCLTNLRYWHDDAQVVSETVDKFYSNKPGIWLSIEMLPKSALVLRREEEEG